MNFKIKYLNIERYETKAFEKYLEEMALAGWELAYLNTRILRFRRSEKTKIKYSVRILDKLSAFEGADPKKIAELKKNYEDAGWRFVANDSRIFIFATDNLSAIPPSYKPLIEELSYNANKSLQSIALKLVCFICLALFILYKVNKFNFFKDSELISAAIVIFPLIILAVLYNMWDLKELLLFKRELRELDDTMKFSLKTNSIKLKINFLSLVIFSYSLIIVVMGILGTTSYLDVFVAIALMNIFQIPTEEIHYRCTLKNKSSSKYIWILIMVFITFSGSIVYKNAHNDKAKNYNVILTLSDFHLKADNKYFWHNKNNLISRTISYGEEVNKYYLNYDYIEVKCSFLVEKYYEDTINDFKSTLSEHNNEGMSCKFEEIRNLPTGMEGVKILTTYSNALIFKVDNKILAISPVKNISQDEVIKVVYDKLNPK